jgi:hypothetical protein
MIEAVILICMLGTDPAACSERTAAETIRVEVQPVVCMAGGEAIVVGAPGSQLAGRVLKVLCGRKV